jgi:2-polyprenyl-3-methyl-5-hydroxy-6-metoxy-1,4-benzoquinol methylase
MDGIPTIREEIRARIRVWQLDRSSEQIIGGEKGGRSWGFFDEHPRFLKTSSTENALNRLNQRYRALIEANRDIIEGQNVLDLASHDGRWSFAAHKAGAKNVLGIEARPHLVEAARQTFKYYGVLDGSADFLEDNILHALDELLPTQVGRFDTVFCFGFLYHTIDHMQILRKIGQLRPKHLIVDTAISLRPGNLIELREEPAAKESNAVGDEELALVGKPTKEALEAMLGAAGFGEFEYYDWHQAGIESWDNLKPYYVGARISVRCALQRS